MFGCFAALVMRQPPGNIAAISIETGVQNTGIAIMLLKVGCLHLWEHTRVQVSFGQPVADMSSTVPVVVSLFTPVPLLFAIALHWLVARARSQPPPPSVLLVDEKVIGQEEKLLALPPTPSPVIICSENSAFNTRL
jgi:hypothetical protein